jgi:hypothetical protein
MSSKSNIPIIRITNLHNLNITEGKVGIPINGDHEQNGGFFKKLMKMVQMTEHTSINHLITSMDFRHTAIAASSIRLVEKTQTRTQHPLLHV